MARIAGVDIPRDKHIVVSLTYIYGIGPTTAKHILERARLDEDTRTGDLTDQQVAQLRDIIAKEV